MKNLILTGLFALTLLSATSCGNDGCDCADGSNCGNDPYRNGNGMSITATIAEDGGTTQAPQGSSLGYFLVGENGSSLSSNGMLTVGQDGSLQLSENALTTEQTYTFYSYSPYNTFWDDALTNDVQFDVNTDQQSDDGNNASNLLRAQATLSSGSTQVVFRHMLAAIVIHIVDQTGNCDLSSQTRAAESSAGVVLRDMQTSVMFNLREGTVTTIPNITSDIQAMTIDCNERRLSATAIVAPQQKSQGDTFVILRTNGSRYSFAMLKTEEMQSGNTYTYRFELTDNGLVYLGSYITDWVSGVEDVELNSKRQ